MLVQFLSEINQYATAQLQKTETKVQVHQKAPKLGENWSLHIHLLPLLRSHRTFYSRKPVKVQRLRSLSAQTQDLASK